MQVSRGGGTAANFRDGARPGIAVVMGELFAITSSTRPDAGPDHLAGGREPSRGRRPRNIICIGPIGPPGPAPYQAAVSGICRAGCLPGRAVRHKRIRYGASWCGTAAAAPSVPPAWTVGAGCGSARRRAPTGVLIRPSRRGGAGPRGRCLALPRKKSPPCTRRPSLAGLHRLHFPPHLCRHTLQDYATPRVVSQGKRSRATLRQAPHLTSRLRRRS